MTSRLPNPAVLGALLAAGIGVAHSYLGERYILTRLFRRTDLPHLLGSDLFTRRTLRFAWHITTVAWWGLAALLLLVAQGASAPAFGRVIALTFVVTALITLVGSRGRHLAWPLFLLVALAAWLASR